MKIRTKAFSGHETVTGSQQKELNMTLTSYVMEKASTVVTFCISRSPCTVSIFSFRYSKLQ